MEQLQCPNCYFNLVGIPEIGLQKDPLISDDYLFEFMCANTSPSKEYRKALHDEVRHLKFEHTLLDDHISRLRKMISKLEKRQKDSQGRVKHIESIYSPARRLPSDILTDIFVAVSPKIVYDGSKTLPTVSQVCHFWRKVAVNFAPLWVNLDLNYEGKLCTNKPAFFLEMILLRSQGHLLSARVHFGYKLSPSSGNPECAVTKKFFDLLIGHSRRWKDMEFDPYASRFLQPVKNNLPTLTSLTLDNPIGLGIIIDWFEEARNLRSLRLSSHIKLHHIHLMVPWERIVSLTLLRCEGGSQDISPFLRQMENLQDLHIVHKSKYHARPRDPSDLFDERNVIRCTLRHLNKLSITGGIHADIQHQLHTVDATALKTLVLASSGLFCDVVGLGAIPFIDSRLSSQPPFDLLLDNIYIPVVAELIYLSSWPPSSIHFETLREVVKLLGHIADPPETICAEGNVLRPLEFKIQSFPRILSFKDHENRLEDLMLSASLQTEDLEFHNVNKCKVQHTTLRYTSIIPSDGIVHITFNRII